MLVYKAQEGRMPKYDIESQSRDLWQPGAFLSAPVIMPVPPAGTFAVFDGTPGDDQIAGTNTDDTFNMADGGNDQVAGRRGSDTFNFGASLTAADAIDGGVGDDVLVLDGNYSNMTVFSATTIANVETIQLAANHKYSFTLDNANVTLGQQLTVDGSALGNNDDLIFDGSDETSSRLVIVGGGGDDHIFAGGARDFIALGGGRDVVDGGAGDDQIAAGAQLDNFDSIDGGAGNDVVSLMGDYSAGLTFGLNTLRNVERLALLGGDDYVLTLGAFTINTGDTLVVDGGALINTASVSLNASALADSSILFLGGAEADVVTIGQSGRDVVKTGLGDDEIRVLGNLTETVRIDGGIGGTDTVVLDGDYSAKLEFLSNTLRNIEVLTLTTGHTYNLVLSDGTIGGADQLSVDASALGSGDKLTFDASNETNGEVNVIAGAANDVLIGGGGDDTLEGGLGNDTFRLTRGGADSAFGGDGSDMFFIGNGLGQIEIVDGGAGFDEAVLSGTDFVMGVVPVVEFITLTPGANYSLDGNPEAGGGTFIDINGQALGPEDNIFFSGARTKCRYDITGGRAADFLDGGKSFDVIYGGDGDDVIDGQGDSDLIDGRAGHDTFVYANAADSSSLDFDSLRINFDEDAIRLGGDAHAITGIDAEVTTGQLSDNSQFDVQLAAALDGNLGKNHAVMFDPDAGSLQFGFIFLVVDLNRNAGYQAGEDLVLNISLSDGTLTLDNFV
jgi:Ca2+-binding RTX toxin-like protein